jgi:aminoglycoside phosphotransferase (APT) family kinase protein
VTYCLGQAVSAFDNLSDEDVISRLEAFDFERNQIGSDGGEAGYHPAVWRFTSDTVVKCIREDNSHEAHTMSIVSSQTSIPVPDVRRIMSWDHSLWLFISYIEGDDLETIWPSLNYWEKLKVARTIRGYIRQLRQVDVGPNRNIPGPVDGSGNPLRCVGRYFTEGGAGPFASYDQMSSWFASKRRITVALEREISVHRNEAYTPEDLSFDDSMPLVLTHGDIFLRNIRLAKDGTLWLIDWGCAGVYPLWFEYASIMACEGENDPPKTWMQLAPMMAGSYRSQHAFLKGVEHALVLWGVQE